MFQLYTAEQKQKKKVQTEPKKIKGPHRYTMEHTNDVVAFSCIPGEGAVHDEVERAQRRHGPEKVVEVSLVEVVRDPPLPSSPRRDRARPRRRR